MMQTGETVAKCCLRAFFDDISFTGNLAARALAYMTDRASFQIRLNMTIPGVEHDRWGGLLSSLEELLLITDSYDDVVRG